MGRAWVRPAMASAVLYDGVAGYEVHRCAVIELEDGVAREHDVGIGA